MRTISPKAFAQMFVHTRNCIESALRLGVTKARAENEGVRLLNDRRVRREIKKLDSDDQQTLCYVKTGLTRLAFGQINDAVRIAFSDEVTPMMVEKADLFNVSEIKRVKGGGVEIKFFDRQKALEKLVELDPDLREVSKAEQFLNAIENSAKGDISSLVNEQDNSPDDTEGGSDEV